MEFRALGPIELWADGQPHDLGPARARGVLAILLLTPRTIVPSDVLIDRLWDSEPPPKARESLSVYIARLRGALRQAVGEDVQLIGRARGYQLDVDPESVDLHQFRRLRRQADALAGSGDYEHAARLLREADGLWRGQALAGVRGDWVARMRDSLEEERRAAILERVECEMELGRHADLVGELHQLLTQYPLDETLTAHQMAALYWTGRPADALSLYRETRRRLVDEQGAEPGTLLAGLHQRILSRDPDLAVRPADARPGRAAAPDTLPPGPADFVGRHGELALLTAEPGESPRVAVLEGMPGVGKTALALHAARLVADQYPDGMLYLSLHSREPGNPWLEPAEALYQLLRMLSVPATQIPDASGERAALWRAQLSRRRAVVILDDAVRLDQIRPLMPAAGRCLIMITTRRRLPELEGARTLTLDVLPVDDSVSLFQRIAGHGPGRGPRPGGHRRPAVRAAAAGHPAHRRPGGRRQPRRAGRADRRAVPGPGAARRHRRGQPGGHGRLRPDLPGAGTGPPAVLPAARGQPGHGHQPARGGRARRLHARRGREGADHPARPPPAGAGAGRPVPLPRPDPRVRGGPRGAGRPGEPAAAGGRPAPRLLPGHGGPGRPGAAPVPAPGAGAGHPAAGRAASRGHPGRRVGLAGSRMAQHARGRAARGPARVEAHVRRPDPRAGRLHRHQRVLGRRHRGPHHGPAGQPRPGRPGPDRPGVPGAQRGQPADRPARGGAAAGRGSGRDLPVAGRPAGRGRRPGPDRHGARPVRTIP